MDLIIPLISILLLVLLNGFFVASEFALVAVRKTRIDELSKKGSALAKLVQRAQKDLDIYISATQFGITIASLALGWVGEPIMVKIIEPLFFFLPHTAALFSAHVFSVITAFSLITFLHIVLGELAPKTIALQRAEKVSLGIIVPLVAFTTFFKPAIYLLNGAGIGVLSLVRLYKPTDAGSVHSEEEVKMILAQSAETGTIPQKEVEMMNNVFRLGEIPVKHIMLPRTDIVAFSQDEIIENILPSIETSLHSRFPVYEGSIDTIVGFIHIKDIYQMLLKTKGEQKKLTDTTMMREIIYVPETKKADRVLLEMRKKRIHIAVVNDEYGGTAGIVTLEDVIESLVGEIQDEFEEPENEMKRMSDGSYIVDGLTSLEKLQVKFDFALKGQGYTTIGGLVFGLLGREPKKDDTIEIGDVTFSVEEMYKKRIRFLRVKKKKS
ncbi:hemolysin family protein [soil metagenome]